MKHAKRTLSIALAFLFCLVLVFPASASSAIDIELVHEQYAWGEMFVGGGRVGSFLIWHDGKLLYESHAKCHGMDTSQAMYSITKSVVAALTGIALQLGYLECTSQKVIDFFPEARIRAGQESKHDMTIAHLLTMTSGMPGMGDSGSTNNFFNPFDSGRAAFTTPQLDAPGETFRYCSGATPQTLVGLLQRATGRNLLCFAQEHLFGPLEMNSVRWDTTWDGSSFGGFGIHMSPRDMLIFGQFHLQNGMWNGQQILPVDWIARSHPHLESGFGLDYGYMFWGGENDLGEFFSAMGMGGNIISIYPALDLIVVRTGNQDWWMHAFTFGIRLLSFSIF